jgi:WD40 repeat protein
MYSTFNGESIANMIGHTSQVSSIFYDPVNNLYVTASWDSDVIVQKQFSSTCFKEIRRLSNNFNRKEVTVMAVSVGQSFIAVGSNTDYSVYVWDYEIGKLLGGLCFRPEE